MPVLLKTPEVSQVDLRRNKGYSPQQVGLREMDAKMCSGYLSRSGYASLTKNSRAQVSLLFERTECPLRALPVCSSLKSACYDTSLQGTAVLQIPARPLSMMAENRKRQGLLQSFIPRSPCDLPASGSKCGSRGRLRQKRQLPRKNFSQELNHYTAALCVGNL